MRIAVVNTKGGVGKTTTAVHLATMLAGAGGMLGVRPSELCGPTLLVDGDPQASAASWAAWRRDRAPLWPLSEGNSPTTVCLAGRAVYDEGRRLANGFAHTVVDAGGRDSSSLRGALLLAEVAIVPVGASSLDAAAITDLLEIASVARELNPELVVRVLLARVDPRTRDTGEMLGYLAEQRLAVLRSRICERVAYRRAVGDGVTVDEMAGAARDSIAVDEMHAAFTEILALGVKR
jgi:chromosome partitioning protein